MYESMTIDPEVAELWLEERSRLTPELREYIDKVAEEAKNLFLAK